MKKNLPPPEPASLQPETLSLERWFEAAHRELPWRQTYNPYHVLVSEVMLQQTQVYTVLPYYERFVSAFPTIQALAESDESDVLLLWSGLGYYRRARNLKAAAERIVDQHGGSLPRSYEALLELPGIGRYMAGAIMSIAFNEPYPIVDGNVRRVLSRVYGWDRPPEKALWEAAHRAVRSGVPRIVNQAMMELGATVCTPRQPECSACPWSPACVAYREDRQERTPAPRKRPQTVRVDLHAVIDSSPDGVVMEERDGLWEFPSFGSPPEKAFPMVGSCRHSITHHRLQIRVYTGKVKPQPGYRRVRFDQVPVTSLGRKIYSVYMSR